MVKLYFIVFCLLAVHLLPCIGQQALQVSHPRIEQHGRLIQISYDILNSRAGDSFEVEVLITGSDGQTLPTTSLKGDVGKGISGGSNRKITWSPDIEGVDFNARIFVELVIKPMTAEDSGYRTGTLMLQSLVFPGLGLSRSRGGPHWIKGVLAYGCLGGSVLMNRMAYNNLESIPSEPDFDAKKALHDTAITQDLTSEILAYSALGIWVADLVWTFVLTSGDQGKGTSGGNRGLTMGGGMDARSGVPLLSLTYSF